MEGKWCYAGVLACCANYLPSLPSYSNPMLIWIALHCTARHCTALHWIDLIHLKQWNGYVCRLQYIPYSLSLLLFLIFLLLLDLANAIFLRLLHPSLNFILSYHTSIYHFSCLLLYGQWFCMMWYDVAWCGFPHNCSLFIQIAVYSHPIRSVGPLSSFLFLPLSFFPVTSHTLEQEWKIVLGLKFCESICITLHVHYRER